MVMRFFSGLMPKTIENKAALRTSITALASVLIAFKLHMPMPFWAGVSVIFLANLYTGSIVSKSILRIFGTLIGVTVGYFLVPFIAANVYLYLVTVFAIITTVFYYYSISRYAYAYLLFGLGSLIVIAQLDVNPDNVLDVAAGRAIEITIGVVVSAVGAYLIFPCKIKDSVMVHIDNIFTQFSYEISQLQILLSKGYISLARIEETNLKLKKEVNATSEMINLMVYEMGISKLLIDNLRLLVELLSDLILKLNYFILALPDEASKNLACYNKLLIDKVFHAIITDLQSLKSSFLGQAPNKKIKLLTSTVLAEIDDASRDGQQLLPHKNAFYYAVRHVLQQINDLLVNLAFLLIEHKKHASPKRHIMTRHQWMLTDLDVIKHSIKAGLSCVVAMLIWLVSNMPGGINGIISSIFIALTQNIEEMKRISYHRALGCLLGGGLALLISACFVVNLTLFILTLFFLVWVFSYINFKSKRYAYVGFQANVALIITFVQEKGAEAFLEPAVERLWGIAVGIASTFVVGNLLWRIELIDLLQGRVKKLQQLIKHNLVQVLSYNPDIASFYEPGTLFWVCRAIFEKITSKNLKGRKLEIVLQAKMLFGKMTLLQAATRFIYESIDRASAHDTAQLYRINLTEHETAIKMLFQDNNPLQPGDIANQLHECLGILETKQVIPSVTPLQLTNLVAYLKAMQELVQQAGSTHSAV